MTKITPDLSVSKVSVSDERDYGAFIPAQLDDFGLNLCEFRVYCRLARRAGNGSCWESINNMAAACKANRKTIMQAIASLINYGMIRQEKRPGKSDIYKLTSHFLWHKLPVPVEDTTSPLEGQPANKPVPQTDTTSPLEGLHQSGERTPPVPPADTKVLPQGSSLSYSQELNEEKESLMPPATAPLGGASPAVVVNKENMEPELTGEEIKESVKAPLTDDELYNHLIAAEAGVIPTGDVICYLLNSKYSTNFEATAKQHHWDLTNHRKTTMTSEQKLGFEELMQSLKEKSKRRC